MLCKKCYGEFKWADQFEAMRREPYCSECRPFRRRAEVRSLVAARAIDPTVNAVLTAWELGEYPTFEQALVALVLHLVEQKEALAEEAVRRSQSQPITIASRKTDE
jgi:hypothetical protein